MTLTTKLVLVLSAGAIGLGTTAWFTYPKKAKWSLASAAKYRFMHCQKCGHEVSYSGDDLEKACVQCESEKGFVPTVESVKAKGATTSPYWRMSSFLFVELVAWLGAIWLVLRKRRDPGAVVYLLTRCPKCSQRLRFAERQAGQPGACRRCKKAFLFPKDSPREEDELEAARAAAAAADTDDHDEE